MSWVRTVCPHPGPGPTPGTPLPSTESALRRGFCDLSSQQRINCLTPHLTRQAPSLTAFIKHFNGLCNVAHFLHATRRETSQGLAGGQWPLSGGRRCASCSRCDPSVPMVALSEPTAGSPARVPLTHSRWSRRGNAVHYPNGCQAAAVGACSRFIISLP